MSSDSGAQSATGGQVHVDTDRIQQGADALGRLAWRLKQAASSFDEQSRSFGEPWGDDKNGKNFLDQYQKPHSDAVDLGVSGGGALADAAGQLIDLVAALKAVEAQAVATGQQMTIQPTDGA